MVEPERGNRLNLAIAEHSDLVGPPEVRTHVYAVCPRLPQGMRHWGDRARDPLRRQVEASCLGYSLRHTARQCESVYRQQLPPWRAPGGRGEQCS